MYFPDDELYENVCFSLAETYYLQKKWKESLKYYMKKYSENFIADKKDIIDAMKKFSDTLQLSGKTATSMGHGLVIEDDHGYLFIETKQDGDK